MAKYGEYVVVGGGIAAVSCVEQLVHLDPKSRISVISASRVVKVASNVRQIGKAMETFDVTETPSQSIFGGNPNVAVLFDCCTKINPEKKEAYTKSGKILRYEKLCLATGGKPKLISRNKHVIGIRDTESVLEFQKKLSGSRRVLIVGNGGIAAELIYELKKCEILWAIKHDSILATFVDAGAAHFLIPKINESHQRKNSETVSKRLKYSVAESDTAGTDNLKCTGSALGPDWVNDIEASGSVEVTMDFCTSVPKNVHVEFECEVKRIISREEFVGEKLTCDSLTETFFDTDCWSVYVQLSNGKIFGCDFVVSATGVVPNVSVELDSRQKFGLCPDGGILVDDQMRSSVKDIYAAGDVCTAGWKFYPHWIQMRLWTQARQMGAQAAKCMHFGTVNRAEKLELDLCFEIFTHVTTFFGFKVILLGLFNSQHLRKNYEALLRIKEGVEFVKVLVQDGKVQGAILIGETDLEETLENLILNGTDVTGLDLLNASVDIEDFFD